MPLQYLLDQGRRILDATVHNANRHILDLVEALREQRAFTMYLITMLQRRNAELSQARDLVAEKDMELLGLRAQVNELENALVLERYQRLDDEASRILAHAPVLPAPTDHVASPDEPASVPMARQPAQRGHGVRPGNEAAAPTLPTPWELGLTMNDRDLSWEDIGYFPGPN